MLKPAPTAWWNKNYSTADRNRDFVDLAMGQVHGCLGYLSNGEDIPDVLRIACIESFWVNTRLLVEFLIKGTGDPRNIDARALVPDWRFPAGEVTNRLLNDWNTASAHLMHFAKERAPENLEDIKPVSAAEMRRIAADLRTVHNMFRETA
ncbi:hypothetical protein ACIQCR_34710 [Streptomyces sp. NPDC093249]|uniref:hypothetical protein n=1 Tax=unclassified Streptomyces TaxID=2593676 RepID=UPI0038083823